MEESHKQRGGDGKGRVRGVGTDLVEVGRIAGVLERQGEAFLRRVFTDAEQRYCDAKSQPAVFYAARFAVKEAVSKAFGTGIGGEMGWLDIEVVHDGRGAPAVRLLGRGAQWAERMGVTEVLVSLSHTDQMAVAMVVVQ